MEIEGCTIPKECGDKDDQKTLIPVSIGSIILPSWPSPSTSPPPGELSNALKN